MGRGGEEMKPHHPEYELVVVQAGDGCRSIHCTVSKINQKGGRGDW